MDVDPGTAFAVFTEEIDCWWIPGPINFHDSSRAYGKRIEPGIGGRLVEVYDDATGEGLVLGRVYRVGARRAAGLAQRDPRRADRRPASSGPGPGGTIVRVEATIPVGGADRGGTAWVRMTPVWLGRGSPSAGTTGAARSPEAGPAGGRRPLRAAGGGGRPLVARRVRLSIRRASSPRSSPTRPAILVDRVPRRQLGAHRPPPLEGTAVAQGRAGDAHPVGLRRGPRRPTSPVPAPVGRASSGRSGSTGPGPATTPPTSRATAGPSPRPGPPMRG